MQLLVTFADARPSSYAPSSLGCSGGGVRELKRFFDCAWPSLAVQDGLSEKALISPITAVKRVNAEAAIQVVVTRRAP